MENLKPHQLSNRCFEARDELRQDLAIETALIERISTLPEDDFCNQSRETLQLGAGYALLARQETFTGYVTDSQHIFAAYFSMQPRNRYLSDEVRAQQQQNTIEAAMKVLEDTPLNGYEDPYDAAALAAFIEGYEIVSSALYGSLPSELPVGELA